MHLIRDVFRSPKVVGSVSALALIAGILTATARVAAAPTTAKTRTVYVSVPTSVPGPTVTVLSTARPTPAPVRTVRVTVSPSPLPPSQYRCSDAQLYLTLTSDRSRYAQGQTIHFTAVLRRDDPPDTEYEHFDPRPCVVDPGGFTVYLTDDSGQPVRHCCMGVYPQYFPYGAAKLALKRGGSYRISYAWDGTEATGASSTAPAYAGTYRAIGQWLYPFVTSPQISFYVDGPAQP